LKPGAESRYKKDIGRRNIEGIEEHPCAKIINAAGLSI